jgi:hypothetical protein
MKGIVFTEFLDMVETTISADAVDDVIEAARIPSGGAYTAVGTYDHKEMVSLVGALSEYSGQPMPDLLHQFGRHLFGRFFVLYPVFFEGVEDALEFLARVEGVIHEEVLKLYPDAELPRFEARWTGPGILSLVYRSPRHMGDLAHGLIEGCVAHFGDPVSIHRVTLPDGAEEFTLARR